MTRHNRGSHQQGFALITVMLLVAVLAVMVTAYFMLTQVEMSTAASSQNSTSGFYAAEAGLNIRGQEVRELFDGFNRPKGLTPTDKRDAGIQPCRFYKKGNKLEENNGEGDFECRKNTQIAASRNVITYITEPGVGAGEEQKPLVRQLRSGRFAGLNAQEFVYNVNAESFREGDDLPEARLQTTFRSQLIPLFQFAAFYNRDLEIAPGADMTLAGRVHSNGDLYLTGNRLSVEGDVTAAGQIYGGGRGANKGCDKDFVVQGNSISCNTGRRTNDASSGYTDDELSQVWQNEEVKQGVNNLTVPKTEILAPDRTGEVENDYWEKADLRVVLVAKQGNDGVTWTPEVQDAEGKTNSRATLAFRTVCKESDQEGPVGTSDTFYNNREQQDTRMLEVDMEKLLKCIDIKGGDTLFGIDKGLKNDTEGGLVFHFSVDDSALGKNSTMNGVNNYGVRVKNGEKLNKDIKGLTVVTNQAMYVQGDYNSKDKKPASFLADSLNILSNSWQDLADDNNKACKEKKKECKNAQYRNLSKGRKASDTKINAAFLAGVDDSGTSGDADYNGGLENYPRLHENWNSQELRIRGSFVSLGTPDHVRGTWRREDGIKYYDPPKRNWNFDEDFLEAGNLPPLSPRFVNLEQQLFTRSFERDAWQAVKGHSERDY